jgi:hypothetical protein
MNLEDFKTKEHYKQYLLEKAILLGTIESKWWDDENIPFIEHLEEIQEQVEKELEEYDNRN